MALPPFHELVDAHGDELLAHARRLTDAGRAEDVVQEALLRALRAYPRLEHADHLRAWLHRITFTAAMDAHRSGRRETLVAEPVPVPVEDPDPLARDAFEALIDGLTDANQAALRLRFVEDLSYDAIAVRLDTTSAAARRRVSTALATLRERSAP